jgi:hypothetical protein
MAIGASDRQVVWTVVMPTVRVLGAGATGGIALAVLIGTVLNATLLGLSAFDPVSLLGSGRARFDNRGGKSSAGAARDPDRSGTRAARAMSSPSP